MWVLLILYSVGWLLLRRNKIPPVMSPNRKNTPNINSFEVRISPNNQKLASSLLLKRMTSTKAVMIPNKTVLGFIVNLNRSEEHTSELQSRENLVCRLL